VAVARNFGFFDFEMYDLTTTFRQFSQTFDWLELELYDSTDTVIATTSFQGGAQGDPALVTPLDVYDVKWAWYHHFIPDAGIGKYAGRIFAETPVMYTHPGWPI